MQFSLIILSVISTCLEKDNKWLDSAWETIRGECVGGGCAGSGGVGGGWLVGWGEGATKPISSVRLINFPIFTIDKTLVTYWISNSYLAGVAAAQLHIAVDYVDYSS